MRAKAAIHMTPMKSMDKALSDENERRNKNKEWFDRGENSKGVPYRYDWYRRQLNFEIVNGKIMPGLSQETPLHERLQNRLRELGFRSYKTDASNMPNVYMDFVIGGTREKLREMAFKSQEVNYNVSDPHNAHVFRDKEIENWALDTYRWTAAKYGEENIIGFNVHLDETTPHIHMQVIPVGKVQKRGRVKAGEERGTKLAVSYAAVVGKTPEDLAQYLDNLHTDYHLQVGCKYGLERGTFFDDLSPEEKALRKHRTKKEYILYDETMKKLEKARKELGEKETDIRKLEKKQKALTTMIDNLEKQREVLGSKLAALQRQSAAEKDKHKEDILELQRQIAGINAKISDKQNKLQEAEKQLQGVQDFKRNLEKINEETKKSISNMADDAIRRHDNLNSALKRKREEIKKMDKSGELSLAQRHIEARDALIYRRWPAARNAVASIFERGNSNTAREFTPQQALFVERAIATSGISRDQAASDLLSLAQRQFDNHMTYSGWVKDVRMEVMSIARRTHGKLNALLKAQPHDAGGGPSYITDLTDWSGNQISR